MYKKLTALYIVLCLILSSIGPLSAFAEAPSGWSSFLYQTVSSGTSTSSKISSLKASYPAAYELLCNDCRSLNITVDSVVGGDLSSVRTLAQSVTSVSSNATLQQMLTAYGNAVNADMQAALSAMQKEADSYIVVRNKPLGGSHYAYTEGISDDTGSPEGNESNFRPGSEMILVEILPDGSGLKTRETVLLSSSSGVIRDPDVSLNGTTVLFSWKKNSSDDFHLYTMDLSAYDPSSTVKQITFGSGVADFEGKFLPGGKIVFSSSRCIQNVDCWKVPVSNLYLCNDDGSNIIRVGYDQVHTTYPTVTGDGRVIYTRWDYNDRNQMYVQAVFQMMPDGTNQTELFGNDSCFPTTLLHTREIPGTSSKYVSISSGHHTWQSGKMVIIDTAVGRNTPDAVTYAFPKDGGDKNIHVDGQNQSGPQYRYPYALNENEFLVSYCPTGWSSPQENTPFGIYYMNRNTGKQIPIVTANGNIAASQLVPVKTRVIFSRPSMVNYASQTGTVYIGNIYEGDGLSGVEAGSAKYLRVVEIEFRSSAIGATAASGTGTSDPYTPVSAANGSWDVKRVLGIVPIEEDGSALFKVPSETPLYFQVLNSEGEMIQSMRSWTTLMPNETFSCVGCHEDKNTTPPFGATTTLAMKKGVSLIQKDLWMSGEEYDDYDPYTDAEGFSYLEQIQPIFNENCISCHNDRSVSYDRIGMTTDNGEYTSLIRRDNTYRYYTTNTPLADGWEAESYSASSSWSSAKAPFGSNGTPPGGANTEWSSGDYIYLRGTFSVTQDQISGNDFFINIAYDESPLVYINGQLVFSKADSNNSDYITEYKRFDITDRVKNVLKAGTNTIAVRAVNITGGRYIGFSLDMRPTASYTTILSQDSTYKYRMTNTLLADGWEAESYSAANSWSSAKAPFGAQGTPPGGYNTSWSSGNYIYLRGTFNVTQDQIDNCYFYINIAYDESPLIYVNGQLVFSKSNCGGSDYITEYRRCNITAAMRLALRSGTNTIAVRAVNTAGGRYIGFSLETGPSLGQSCCFSLSDESVSGQREKLNFALSYLVLTGSKVNGNQFKANSTNGITNWISSMSQCEMIAPNTFGSSKSNLIALMEQGHGGVRLSDSEINLMRAWIDLGVPFRGTYDEADNWSSGDMKEFEEKENKKAYYERLDSSAKSRLANGGTDKIDEELTIEYTSGGSIIGTAAGTGLVELVLNKSISSGDKIKVTLPEGATHLYFCLTSRMAESLIYVPDGVFEYTVPSDLSKIFPSGLRSFNYPQMYARIPTAEEMAQETNLAVNAYDTSNASSVFPHATATDTYSNESSNPEFQPRNAIDGFNNNRGHGTYPLQSWGPNQGVNAEFKVDFGRPVLVSRYVVTLRGDFPHDGGFTDVEAVFSDGTALPVTLLTTADKQEFELPYPIETESFVLRLKGESGKWSSVSEVEVYGTDVYYTEPGGDLFATVSVRGTVTSFGSADDEVTLQLIPKKPNAESYQTTVTGLSAEYGFDDVLRGAYTLRVIKAGHAVREYSVTVRTVDVMQNVELCLAGDIDIDGDVDFDDLIALSCHVSLARSLTRSLSLIAADLNGDGVISASDLTLLARFVNGIDP